MLLCLQGFEKREYDATTWLRVKVKSAEPSDFIEASGQLKSFVEEAKKNTKGMFVSETCYCAVRSGCKHHRAERQKEEEKNYCAIREIEAMFPKMRFQPVK